MTTDADGITIDVRPPSPANALAGYAIDKWVIEATLRRDGHEFSQAWLTKDRPTDAVIYTCKANLMRDYLTAKGML